MSKPDDHDLHRFEDEGGPPPPEEPYHPTQEELDAAYADLEWLQGDDDDLDDDVVGDGL